MLSEHSLRANLPQKTTPGTAANETIGTAIYFCRKICCRYYFPAYENGFKLLKPKQQKFLIVCAMARSVADMNLIEPVTETLVDDKDVLQQLEIVEFSVHRPLESIMQIVQSTSRRHRPLRWREEPIFVL